MAPSSPTRPSRVAGVDRWRKGWVVALSADAGRAELLQAAAIDEVLEITHGCAVVAIDMPMALPVSGRRIAEETLKSHLGAAGRSIFYSPTRAAIACADRASADACNRAAGGGGISAQSWGLSGSIREVRGLLVGRSEQAHWWETHPESSFAALRPDQPLASKKSALGVVERLDLLGAHFDDPLAAIRSAGIIAPIDDALDALVASWSARRIADGTATLYGPSGRDDEGFPHGILI